MAIFGEVVDFALDATGYTDGSCPGQQQMWWKGKPRIPATPQKEKAKAIYELVTSPKKMPWGPCSHIHHQSVAISYWAEPFLFALVNGGQVQCMENIVY